MNAMPQELRRFLHENIDCVDQLRVLLHVFENQDQSWTPDAVAARLHLDRRKAALVLNELASRGLLAVGSEGPSAYHLGPLSWDQLEALDHLSQFDHERPVTLINVVSARTRQLAAG
jgi:hypothetical protein